MPDLTKDEMNYIEEILDKEHFKLNNALMELDSSSIRRVDPVYTSLGMHKAAIEKMKQCITNLQERKM